MLNKNLMKKYRFLLSMLTAMMTVIAFCHEPVLQQPAEIAKIIHSNNGFLVFIYKLRLSLNGYGIFEGLGTILLGLAYFRFINDNKNKSSKSCSALALCFSFFTVIGQVYSNYGSFSLVLCDLYGWFMILISLLGCFLFFKFLLVQLFEKLNQYQPSIKKPALRKMTFLLFEQHPFIGSFLVLLVCTLPYLLFFYPGSVQWDGLNQLNQVAELSWSNHHPATATFLMGICMKIGQAALDDNFGIFVYTFLQSIFSISVFSLVLSKMKQMKVSLLLRKGALLFFALFPLWPMNAYTLVKDTGYYLFFLLFFLQIVWIGIHEKEINFLDCGKLLGFGLGMWFFRNDGIYVAFLSLIAFLFYRMKKENILRLGGIMAVLLLVNSTYHGYFMPMLKIEEGSVREMMSIVIQQTGRYAYQWSDEINEEEHDVILELFQISKTQLAEQYNPENSDDIRFYFLAKPNSDQMKRYFKVWAKQFLCHPLTYIEATLHNTYGYFYPDCYEYKDGLAWYTIIDDQRVNVGLYDLFFIEEFSEMRIALENMTYVLRELPGIALLFSAGFYSWILLFVAFYLISIKKMRSLILLVPLFGILGIACLSPVNGYIRYIQPLMVSAPLLIAYLEVIITKRNGVIDL